MSCSSILPGFFAMNSIAQLSVLLMVSVPAWIRSPSTPFHQIPY